MSILNRRRFLAIAAASAALPAYAAGATTSRWTGRALGGHVSMQLVGVDQDHAARVFSEVEAELSRLEGIFSLYRTDSEISRLNKTGVLMAPSQELLQVLGMAGTIHHASGGQFDPTVQPVWDALATGADVEGARTKVGWSRLHYDAQQIRIDGALTLNGIAQGAITDRIADLLKSKGLRDVLVDMGEIAALGKSADGNDWAVGVAAPNGDVVTRLSLSNRAVATSAPRATIVGEGQGHILSPTDKAIPQQLVSISAPRAALADALSTAACLMSRNEAEQMVANFDSARIEALI